MLDNFVTFEGSPNGSRAKAIRVTLGPNRTFLISRPTWERMGNPKAVELAFDAVDRKDVEGTLSFLTQDAVFTVATFNAVHRGRDGEIRAIRAWRSTAP